MMIIRTCILLSFLLLFFSGNVVAQAVPQKLSYQAVLRDAQGNLLQNANVSLRFSILTDSTSGSVVYQETHANLSTSDLGLVQLHIGQGQVNSGLFSSISWGSRSFFLQVELNTGNGYQIMGSSELISVPYALHSATADAVNGGSGFRHYIGEKWGGGVIFHLYRDSLGQERGLIVSIVDQGALVSWDSDSACINTNCFNVPNCENNWNGRINTQSQIAFRGSYASAAQLCVSYSYDGFQDWYLPAIQELNMLWKNLYDVNRVLSSIPGAQILSYEVYWSSTETDSYAAWLYGFLSANVGYYYKYMQHRVRAIRSF